MSVLKYIPIAALALALTGCGHEHGNQAAHQHDEAGPDSEPEIGVTFNPTSGLSVPATTARYIGLQVADVTERKLTATLPFSAQVYRTANEPPPASASPTDPPTALASGNISPADAANLTAGQTVTVQSDENSPSLPGRIVTLNHGFEKASGQVEVLLTISDASQPLPFGASVSVNAPLGVERTVMSIPRSALLRTVEGDFVYTVSGDHFVRAPVKPGVINPDFVAVTEGLYAGDQIVVSPVLTLWLAELQTLRGGESCAHGH